MVNLAESPFLAPLTMKPSSEGLIMANGSLNRWKTIEASVTQASPESPRLQFSKHAAFTSRNELTTICRLVLSKVVASIVLPGLELLVFVMLKPTWVLALTAPSTDYY